MSNKRQKQEIEYAAPPVDEDPDIAIKVQLLQELKQNQERMLAILEPVKSELEQLKLEAIDLRNKVKAVNLDIQMNKLREQQRKLTKE
jgi:hypothetical protein